MVVYIVYGFRWPRLGNSQAPGICAHIVSYNLLDAAAEYLQEAGSAKAILQSFKRIDPNIPYHLPGLRILEQYDPEDTSDKSVSQPYAYVASKVVAFGDGSQEKQILSLDMEELLAKGSGLSEVASEAFGRLRDFLAPDAKIGWYVVYNGDPERAYPRSENDEDEDESMDGTEKGDGQEEYSDDDTEDKRGSRVENKTEGQSTVWIPRQMMFIDDVTDLAGWSRARKISHQNPKGSKISSLGVDKSDPNSVLRYGLYPKIGEIWDCRVMLPLCTRPVGTSVNQVYGQINFKTSLVAIDELLGRLRPGLCTLSPAIEERPVSFECHDVRSIFNIESMLGYKDMYLILYHIF